MSPLDATLRGLTAGLVAAALSAAPAQAGGIYGRPDPGGTSRIAFESNRGRTWDIWTIRSGGSDRRKLAASSPRAHDRKPSWAPWTNLEVRFAGPIGPGPESGTTRVRVDGSYLTHVDRVTFGGLDVPFTPGDSHGSLDAVVPDALVGTPVCVRRPALLAGRAPESARLTAPDEPPAADCPDTAGEQQPLVFQSDRSGNPDLWAWDPRRPAGARNPINLTRTPRVAESAPAWSPYTPGFEQTRASGVQSLIAYVATRNGDSDLYVLDPERPPSAGGPSATRITSGPALDGNPEWGNGGRQLAFDRSVGGGERELWTLQLVYDAAARRWAVQRETALTPGQLRAQDPTWPSLNATEAGAFEQLAFAGPSRLGGHDSLGYLEEGRGTPGALPFTDPAALTAYTGPDAGRRIAGPAWSPGGDAIAFARRRGGRFKLAVLRQTPDPDTTDTSTRFITGGRGEDRNPDWQALMHQAQPYPRRVWGRASDRSCRRVGGRCRR